MISQPSLPTNHSPDKLLWTPEKHENVNIKSADLLYLRVFKT